MKISLKLLAFTATFPLLMSSVSHAQQTWDGDTDTTFSTGANWVSGTAPTDSVTAANTATFGATVTANQPNLTASRSVGGLIFQSTSGGWTLSGTGNTLTVGSGGIVDSATSGTTNIAPTIAIGASRSFTTQGGTLRLNGGLQLTGNAGLSGTTGIIEVSSISYEGAETTNTFLKSGGATLNLTGAAQSGWVGAFTLQSGGLNVGNNTALGGGTFNWTNSSEFGALSNVTIANNFVHTAGTHTYVGNNSINRTGTTTNSGGNRLFINTIGGNAVLTLAGNVYLSEASGTGRTFSFNGAGSTGTTVVSGNISNFDGGPGTAGSVGLGSSAASGGTVILTGNNTYTGATTMSGSVTAIFRNTASRSSGTTVTSGGTNVVGLGVGGAGFYSQTDVQNLFANTLAGFSMAANADVGIDTTAGNFTYSVNQGGTRDLVKLGANTLTLSGSNSYTGATIVSQGTLLINGSTATGSAVSVASGATLGGSGTVGGNTTISGIHSPGTSPGTQTFSNNLTYNSGSSVAWELVANSTSGRGTNFDGINVTGNLDFAGPTNFGLSFNFAGSTVDWSNSFWDTSKTGTSGWLIYDVTGALSNFSNLALTTANWADGQGDLFNTVRAGSTFSFYQDGNDIYLNYAVIPEPSTWALLAISLTALVVFRRRRTC